jgi:dTDP-4-amino-4,6-dideoxygalactose transaminase
MKKIEFFKHSINSNDRKRVNRVLKSIFLTTGKEVDTFERKFSRYIGRRFTVGLTSCTAALHLALIELGIGPGDEVITTPMSFCATANAIIQAGAKPIFADVEEETGNINAELIEPIITGKTKAIIPVHLYGQMCDMKKIKIIAKRNKLKIIEDASHAVESSRDGIRVGQLSDAACFSFYATKNITSGEGGALSTDRRRAAETLKKLRLHGIDSEASERYTKRYRHWDMPVFGWKYNMDNIQAALLIGQLERIEDLWKKRAALWKRYDEQLHGLKGIRSLKVLPGVSHARHLYTVLVQNTQRDSLLYAMQRRGVGVAVNYRPIHLLKYYRKTFGYSKGKFPVAEHIGSSILSLPLYPSLSKKDLRYVVSVLKNSIHN